MKFRKKPVVVSAIQFTGENWAEVLRWILRFDALNIKAGETIQLEAGETDIKIRQRNGTLYIKPGDWIIKGSKELYTREEDIFSKNYEPVEEKNA